MLFSFTERVEQFQVSANNFKSIRKTIDLEEFHPQHLIKVSKAAAGLCSWVINIVAYHDIQMQYNPIQQEKQQKVSKPKKAQKVPDTVKMNLEENDTNPNSNQQTPFFQATPAENLESLVPYGGVN